MRTKQDKSTELIQAEKFIEEYKLDEAEEVLRSFEEKRGNTPYDIIFCHSLKCELLTWQGLYEDAVKLAEQTYKESLVLGKNILSVDNLLTIALALLSMGQGQAEKVQNIINQSEELLKTLTRELGTEFKQREERIAYIKGWAYEQNSKADQAIKQFELSISLGKELNAKSKMAFSFVSMGHVFMNRKGEFDRALKCLKQGLAYAEESGNKNAIAYCLLYIAELYSYKGELGQSITIFEKALTIYNEINNKVMKARLLLALGNTYVVMGELNHSISAYEQCLELFRELEYKFFLAITFNSLSESLRMKGDLNRALECVNQSMALNRELGTLRNLSINYDVLIKVLTEMGDLEQAQNSLREFEQLNNQIKDKFINFAYLFNKALVLKTSPRAHNRVKAEEILRQILEEKDLPIEFLIEVLLNLSELLLTELQITNDIEVIIEIQPFISQLLDLCDKSHSYWILCETHLLQAKLSLLTFDIKTAQRFLAQAEQIAERFELKRLVIKIVNEKEDLLKKLDLWEKIKEAGAPMSDRFELARLNEQIAGMARIRAILTTQVIEEKVAVSKERKICLVCRGEVLRFSYICECGAIYCENCAKAIIDLENMCWVCDNPIDYTKPVRLKVDELEEIHVDKKKKKN